ncbi:MAG TPA: RdgB/HAM1 family non-canonical purine NTP pyrophosphatase [archaeon]|nr:RdgB/HAM1 family non-canonical purine NTP pyrophosphatase [archaeon]
MKKIYFLSSNKEKIKEIKLHLRKFGIEVIGKRVKLLENELEMQEQIAKEKAVNAAKLIKRPVIAEDTGLYLLALNNFPGIHSKFVFKGIGLGGLLKLLEGKSRKAFFKTVVSYCEPNKKPIIFTGICRGKISGNIRKPVLPKVPYDSIFIPDGEERTFSQMTKEEKAKYSHRARATEKFAKWFVKH